MGVCASLFCPCWGARHHYNSIDDDDDDQDFVGGKGGYKGGRRHRYRQQQQHQQQEHQQQQQPVGRPSPASYNTTARTVPDSPASSASGSGKAGPVGSSGGVAGSGGPLTNAGGAKGNRGSLQQQQQQQQQQGSGQGVQEQQGGFHDKYDLCDVIGVGSTSTVHRCVERATGKEFACKIIDKRMIETRFRGLLDQFQVEISVLKALDHPNIIHLADVFETEPRIYMVMELMRGGELFDYVVEKGTLSEEEASGVVRRLASAIAYMHAQEVIHRDLKPENLLLTHRGTDAEVRIIDFGLSKMLSNGTPQAKSFLGTRGYLAPEMLQRQTYSKTIDVWALGVIAFVLLCGCLPFDDDAGRVSAESVHQRFQLRFPSWASNLSTGAKDLLCHLLDINPRTRYTAEQAFNHPWVQERGNSVKANNYLQSPRNIRRIRDAAASHLSFPRNSNSGLNLAALAVTASSSVCSSTGGGGGGAATSPPRASPSFLRSFSGQGPLGPPLLLHPSASSPSSSSLAAQAGGSYGYGYYQYQPAGSSPSTSSYHAQQPPQQHYPYAPPPLLPPAIPPLPVSAASSASASLPSPAPYHAAAAGTGAYPPAPLPPFVGYPPMPLPPPGGGGARAEGPAAAAHTSSSHYQLLGQSAGSHGSSSSMVYGGSPASGEARGYRR